MTSRLLSSVTAAACVLTFAAFTPAAHAAAPPQTNEGRFHKSAPTRLLDTRTAGGPVGVGQQRSLQITGRAGVPTTGVKAVVVNITAINSSAEGYVTAYASGTARPTISAVNFGANWTGATTATVPVGADGKINLYLGRASADIVVDLVGYYSTSAATGELGSLVTFTDGLRLADTRTTTSPVQPGQTLEISADWAVGEAVPTAVAVNITAIDPMGAGYLTAWDGASPFPATSSLNFAAGRTTANYTVVPVRPLGNGKYGISIRNRSWLPTHIAVDALGVYYTEPNGTGFIYNTLPPTRVLDTRNGTGAPATKLGNDSVLQFSPPAALYGPATLGFSGTITGVKPSTNTYLTQYSGMDTDPGTSNLNLMAGQNQSNGFSTPSWHNASTGQRTLNIYNQSGSLDVVEDVTGRYDASEQVLAAGSSAQVKASFHLSAPKSRITG